MDSEFYKEIRRWNDLIRISNKELRLEVVPTKEFTLVVLVDSKENKFYTSEVLIGNLTKQKAIESIADVERKKRERFGSTFNYTVDNWKS